MLAAGSTTARHLHVAGVGWNTQAGGMLNGSYWGMQQIADGHVVQVQLPHTSDDDLIWGTACFLGFWKSGHSFMFKEVLVEAVFFF